MACTAWTKFGRDTIVGNLNRPRSSRIQRGRPDCRESVRVPFTSLLVVDAHLLMNGIPINYLSRWLGHSSVQTTLIYPELVPDTRRSLASVP